MDDDLHSSNPNPRARKKKQRPIKCQDGVGQNPSALAPGRKRCGPVFSRFALLCIAWFLFVAPSLNYLERSNSNAPTLVEKPTLELSALTREDDNQISILQRCRDVERKRGSSRILPQSNVRSMFNCDLPKATCKYYYPANFFDADCGIGRAHVHHATDAEAKNKNSTLWLSQPYIGFPTLTMNNLCIDHRKGGKNRKPSRTPQYNSMTLIDIGEHHRREDKRRCLTERISMIHVHKSGGSSLHHAFNALARNINATKVRHNVFSPGDKPSRERKNAAGISIARESLSHAIRYPTESFGPEQHVIFAVVRDPLARFISSIGQAMGGKGSKGNKISNILQGECIKSTSAETLKCAAKYVKEHGFWIEMHFTPQALEIAFATLWQDVPVAVFPFSELQTILKYLGSLDWERYGSHSYRSHKVLEDMTVADYDDESLELVCEIYEMDVIMQRSLDMETSKCDPFIPRRKQNALSAE